MELQEVSCPRCGNRMELWVEVELKNGNGRRIRYYYKCPRCLNRLEDLTVSIERKNGKLVLEAEERIYVLRRR
jgi:DNA-directed RNA polymerase subunit RPC12/RpoP